MIFKNQDNEAKAFVAGAVEALVDLTDMTDEADVAREADGERASRMTALLMEPAEVAVAPAPGTDGAAKEKGRTRASALLSRDEIARFTQRNDLKAGWVVAFNWLFIAAIFAVVGAWPNPLTILLALILLGGRQLGLGVIMHDCGHRAMFTNPKVNDFVGQWMCASPILSNLEGYRNNHARHHVLAGTDKDPDLPNYRDYAVTRASFRRKIIRDLTGRTGFKQAVFLIRVLWFKRLVGPAVVNGLMLAACWAAGRPWLYLLWPAAYLTTYMLYSRIRNAAEHAVVPDLYDPDPTLHTHTTYAHWWEKLTVAPNRVNFHIEHHLLPTVPPYNLKELHAVLKSKGAFGKADLAPGYFDVIRRLTIN